MATTELEGAVQDKAAAQGHSSWFRPDVEGLRGLAILSVVAYHCGVPGVPGGFVGVDVFFALSGYLITMLLVREAERSGRINLVEFYARRVRRLLPAGTLALVATVIVGMFVLTPDELTFTARAGRAASLNLSNVFFGINAADYFGPKVKFNPILHTWSLAVEEQFYVAWPAMILLFFSWFRTRIALRTALLALTVISFASSIWFTQAGGTFAFYQLPARAWEFGCGGLAALALMPTRLRQRGPIIGMVGALLLLVSFVAIEDTVAFPGWIAALPVGGTCLVLMSCAIHPEGWLARTLAIGPSQWLGRLSYSWYLWHWPVLVFFAALIPTAGWQQKMLAALVALAIAWLSYRVVEQPLRSSRALASRPRLSLAMGLGLAGTALLASQSALYFARVLQDSPSLRVIEVATADIASLDRSACVVLGESFTLKACEFGPMDSPMHVVLFGDSHAIQWFDAINDVARRNAWRVTTLLKSGCPALGPARTDGGTACEQWRRSALQRIAVEKPTVVVLGSATNLQSVVSATYLEAVREGTRSTLAHLAAANVPGLIIRDTPRFDFDVPACLGRSRRLPWRSSSLCNVSRSAAIDERVHRAERDGATGLRRVAFVDMTARLCPGAVCRTEWNGYPMYRDDNHLAARYASTLGSDLEGGLRSLLETGTKERAEGLP